ncbi:probable Cell division control protein 73 [Zygosaccharomyces bailii]|nr:probable Cell division control protein 73 [Zygosaccharomyces bailii]
MSTLLVKLRKHLKAGDKLSLLKEDGNDASDIVEAKTVSFGTAPGDNGEKEFLDEPTEFELEGEKVPLRAIIQCWIHRNSSAADYLADCQNKQLTNISFLQRTDLLNWLSGQSDSSQYVSPASENPQSEQQLQEEDPSLKATGEQQNNSGKEHKAVLEDPILDQTLSHERPLLDHNTSLHGTKLINYGYLVKDSELKLVQSIKSSLRSKKPGKSGQGHVHKPVATSKAGQRKDPIILIPSAASSVFTMANIKQFLEGSQYVYPRELPASQSDLVTVEKRLDRLSKPVRFLIVNNTRMFTKPEYWDRVIAVFTMGHTWQFNNYQWNTPAELFQHCKGYYFHFSGDIVPRHVQQWNVQRVELDKSKRFKDVEVARFFWSSIEKELLARGYR